MALRRHDLQPIAVASNTITRPAQSPVVTYASGDLVANNTTAASVTPFTFTFGDDSGVGGETPRAGASCFRIERVRIVKSTTSTTNASFRVHFFTSDPTATSPLGITSGDNVAMALKVAGYVGACDVTVDRAFNDGAHGAGIPLTTTAILCNAGSAVYAFLEARAAYTPGSGETFTLTIEGYRI